MSWLFPVSRPRFSGQLEEQPGVFAQPRHPLGLRFQDSYRRQGCGGGRSGNADAKDKTGGRVFKVFDQGRSCRRCSRRNCPATCSSCPSRYRRRAGSTPKCSPMPRPWLPRTPIECASSTIKRTLCRLLDFDEPRQVGKIAVHAVDAFNGQQHAAIFVAILFQQAVGGLPVVVGKGPPPRAGEQSRPARCCCGPGRRAAPGRRGRPDGR